MRNIRVVFAVLSLSVVLVAGVADELQAQEKRQGWIKRLRYRRELRRSFCSLSYGCEMGGRVS